ncbi:MAG: EAL domain-containing protein [Deinococcales bacterium]
MNLELVLLALPLVTAVVTFTGVAWGLLRRRLAGAVPFAALAAAVLVWTVAVLVSAGAADAARHPAWVYAALSAAALVGPLWLVAAVRLADRRLPWLLALLVLVPGAVAAATVWLPAGRQRLWRGLAGLDVAGIQAVTLRPADAMWVWWLAAGLALMLAAMVVLGAAARAGRAHQRAGMGAFALAATPPMALAAAALVPAWGLPVIDLTPLGFGASGVLFAWGLERQRLERRGPPEYREVFAGVGDGLVLVDETGMVLDVNPAAERALGVAAPTVLGRPLSALRRDLATMGRESVVLEPPEREAGAVYEARAHALPGGGRLLLIRDVTARRASEVAWTRRAEVLAATQEASRELLRQPDWALAVDDLLSKLGAAVRASRVTLLDLEEDRGTRPDQPARQRRSALYRRWETAEALAWEDGTPPYGSQLLTWASTSPGFAGHVQELPAHDRDRLGAMGVGYVALFPVTGDDNVKRMLAFEWPAPAPAWLPLVVDTLRAAPAALEAAVGRRQGELGGERSRRFQATLLEATRELLAQEVSPAFYQVLLERAVAVIPGAQAGCVLVRADDDRFEVAAADGSDPAVLSELRFGEAEVRTGSGEDEAPRLLTGSDLDAGVEGARTRLAHGSGAGPGPAATLVVPVLQGGRLEASLRLDNLESESGFAPEAATMAEAFGLQVGALLQRLRLEERRDRAARMSALLANIERLLLAGGRLQTFLPMLARIVLEVPGTGFERMAVLGLGPDGVTAEAYDASGSRDASLEASLGAAGWLGGGRGPLASLDDEPGPSFCEAGDEREPAPAYAAQPLMLRGRPWGVLAFFASTPRRFDAQVRDTLAQLGSSIELALVRQDDADQRAWQLAKLEAFVGTSEALRGASRRRDVVARSLQAVLEMTRADVCNLYLLDQDAEVLRLSGSRASSGPGVSAAPEWTVPHGVGLPWRVMEAGRTLSAFDAGGLADAAVPEGAARPRAFLGTPLRNRNDEIVGVLSALLHGGGRRFERDDAGFVEATALACGNALDRLALLEQSRAQAAQYRDLYDAAKHQTAELTLLDRVRAAVATELDLQSAFASAVEATAEVLGYQRVALFASDGNELTLQHRVGYGQAEATAGPVAALVARVAEDGEPVLQAAAAPPEDAAQPADDDAESGSTWQAAVPLRAQERVVGVLAAEGGGRGSGEAELRLLSAVGDQLGVAVERARLYSAVRESEQRFRLLAEHMQDLVCLHGRDGRFEYVSPSASAVLGYEPAELVGQDPYALIHDEDREVVRTNLQQRLGEGAEAVQVRYRLRSAAGDYLWLETVARSVRDEAGRVTKLVTSSRDITERRRIEEQLVQGALFDDLTGLPNRVLLLDRLRQALSRAVRNEAWRFALLFLDLDRFKVVNDSLGHNAGDELLKALGTRLKTCVRGSDTVARLGGDEFCVLVEDVDGLDHVTASALRIQAALAEPFTIGGHDIFTSASIGVALSAPHYREPQELLRDADIAMYRAKAGGKARYAVFDESMHTEAFGAMQLETSLHRAPERGELFLEYLPVYRLAGRALVGVEALVRWRHPQRGLIPPAEFVPLAEDSGLIVTIDRWVLGEATRQLAAWQRDLAGAQAPVVSVNVSARHFAIGGVDSMIRSAIEAAGVPASLVKLEINEGALMGYPEAAADALARLRQLGVRVQVDDFGTGFSSLKVLHSLPIDSLKIDRSFVHNVDSEPASQHVVTTIVGLANNLGIDVVAEGIEREEELETLVSLGCELGQGYLLAPPITASEVAHKLQAQRTR